MNREILLTGINESFEATIIHPITALLQDESLSNAAELINQHIDELATDFPDYYDFKYDLVDKSSWNHCYQSTNYHYYYNLTAIKQGK